MNTKVNKTAIVFELFLMSFLIFSNLGCKKEIGIDPNSTLSSTTNQIQSKPLTFSINEKVDIDLFVFIPCANGGAGEDVILSGPLHILSSFTISDNMISGKNHYQPQGISGIGQITGDKYQATGITLDQFKGSLINGQYETSYVNNFRIIGQGPGNNYLVHSVTHLTYNANGELTAFVDNFSVDCK
ncbi:MAG: hypothetical protein JWP81_1201 [Ferruginibacter sp.]|nr:hypothetical protein [Ferruginibacter sp.]